MTGFLIGSRPIGGGAPCLIVAEVAQAHEGSLSLAHAYIDAVAKAGADAVKFQCHIAEAESTPDEPWRMTPQWPQDESRYAYWKRMEFSPEQWSGLAAHAEAKGLIFLCSPFSVEAVKLLDPLVPAWKVASGEVTNTRLLLDLAETGKGVILSAGMATESEITAAIYNLRQFGVQGVGVLHCASIYPTPPERTGLGDYYRFVDPTTGEVLPTGLSDHSGTIYAGLAAVTLGASVVEVHVKLSPHDQGFDAASSITVDDLARLVEGVRFIEKAMKPVDKDALARELEPVRQIFMRKHERKAAHPFTRGAFVVSAADAAEGPDAF